MKANWVFFGFVAVELLLVGVLIGSMTVTGVPLEDAPHGMPEYFIWRHGGLLAGSFALLGGLSIYSQMKLQRSQHRDVLRMSLRDELRASEIAGRMAATVLIQLKKPTDLGRRDLKLQRFTDAEMTLIQGKCSIMTSRFAKLLDDCIEAYYLTFQQHNTPIESSNRNLFDCAEELHRHALTDQIQLERIFK